VVTAGAAGKLVAWRRTAVVGAVVGGAVLVTGLTGIGTSGAQTGFNNGTGSAIAESIRVNPVAGGLSFGIGLAESLSGHQNTVATAESRSANLGVIGTTLAAPGCDEGDPTLPKEDQPQPLRVDSTEEGAAEGRDEPDPKVPGIDRFVRATTAPFAESRTTSPGLELPGGVLTIGPTVATTTSGVVDGVRQATATTEISSISAGAGAVQLTGLRWTAAHRSADGLDEPSGSFSIASATVGGTPIPVEDPTEALTELNAALNPLGLTFRPPTYHADQTSRGTLATVDSLTIAMVPSPLRDGVVGPILSGAQPVRTELFQALIDIDCGTATFITILDIVLNATGAGGELGIELGGVQASTSPLNAFSGLGQLPPLPPLAPPSLPSPGSVAVPNLGSGSTGTGSTIGSAAPAAPTAPVAAAPEIVETVDAAEVIKGKRGGAMLAVAGAGLALLAATAEGDRRKMRRAMREIPLES
jgi:hypothetical protein